MKDKRNFNKETIKGADKKTDKASRETNGKLLEVAEAPITPIPLREARLFTPKDEALLNQAPEAITAGEKLPHIDTYSSLHLDALPTKGLKAFLVSLALFFSLMIGWQVYSVFRELLEVHWSLASGFITLLAIVTGLGLRLLRNTFYDAGNLGTLENIHEHADALQESRAVNGAAALVNELREFYADKPQAPYLKRCLDRLPDYSDDSEVIDHLHRAFLKPLDKEALRRVSAHSLQTGTIIALSPWAAMDTALVFWRNIKMVEDIAQIYGVRPSLGNRFKLVKKVIGHLAVVGASQVLVDSLVQNFATAGVGLPVLGAFAQGAGAGIYTAKIGIATIEVSRPMTLAQAEKPNLSAIIEPMVDEMRKQLSRRSKKVEN